jgi:hypothetical protein
MGLLRLSDSHFEQFFQFFSRRWGLPTEHANLLRAAGALGRLDVLVQDGGDLWDAPFRMLSPYSSPAEFYGNEGQTISHSDMLIRHVNPGLAPIRLRGQHEATPDVVQRCDNSVLLLRGAIFSLEQRTHHIAGASQIKEEQGWIEIREGGAH